jgi:hypothetical protein
VVRTLEFGIFGDELEEGLNGFGDRLGAGGGEVKEDPVRLSAGEEGVVGGADEGVFAEGEGAAIVGDPGVNANPVAGEGGAEVVDVVGTNDPGGVDLERFRRAPGGVGMRGRGVLHPADEFDVVDVAVGVDGIGGDDELVGEDGGGCHGGILGAAWWLREGGAQPRAGAGEAGFEGVEGEVEDFGGVFEGELFDVDEEDGPAEGVGEVLEGADDGAVGEGFEDAGGRGGRGRRMRGIGEVGEGVDVELARARSDEAEVVDPEVAEDGEEPGADVGVGAECGKGGVGAEEAFLEEVLGVGAAVGEDEGGAQEEGLVRPDELLKLGVTAFAQRMT